MSSTSSPDGSTVEASFRGIASTADRCCFLPEAIAFPRRSEMFQRGLTQWTTRLFVLAMFVVFSGAGNPCHAEIRTDFLMDSDPEMNIPDPVKHFSPALK